jgi:hypothetical protein
VVVPAAGQGTARDFPQSCEKVRARDPRAAASSALLLVVLDGMTDADC